MLCAAGAAGLLLAPRPRLPSTETPQAGPASDRSRRRVWPWVLLASLGAWSFLDGPWAVAGGGIAGAVTWGTLTRSEDPRVRRDRERARRDLAHLVGLLASALRSGAPPDQSLAVVRAALPGAATARLDGAQRLLDLGAAPEQAWAELAADPVLAPLGRVLTRSSESGAPVAPALERLADELGEQARAGVEDRARAVGVRAAVPLGLCLLPSFLLLGVVPVVAGLLSELLP